MNKSITKANDTTDSTSTSTSNMTALYGTLTITVLAYGIQQANSGTDVVAPKTLTVSKTYTLYATEAQILVDSHRKQTNYNPDYSYHWQANVMAL